MSGDDAETTQIVAHLIEKIGFGPYDIRSLRDSGEQQTDAAIYNQE